MKHSLLFVLLAGITFSLQAQIPRVLSYQGVFSDTLGTLKPDGTYSFTFKLYDFPSGGAAVWSETKDLEVKGGVFSTQLGNMTPFASQSFDVPFWLGITVGSDPEIVPRVALSSVPYSMNAVRADTAAFALSTPVPPSSDSARIAGALSLPFEGTVSAVGQAMAITNSKGSAIYAEADSGSALDAYSINGNAVYATTDKSTGIGLYATAYSLTGLNYGVIGMSYSNSGLGGFFEGGQGGSTGPSYGAFGRSLSTDGYGLYGESSASSGSNYGVYGKTSSSTGYGVYGRASSAAGTNFGVYGTTASTNGGFGLFGQATGSTGFNYGVYGTSNSTDGYAGFFSGKVHVGGTLSKAAGSFKIDHPLDPANKYLSHSFVESPDMMNIYNGNVQLDGGGEAWVELPEWFGALNRDFRYQLTCIGGFAPVYVASEIENNRFSIAGGNAGLKVSWQVTGIRKDAYAEKYRIQVEEEKKGEEKGLFLNPEAFGMTKEMGVPAVQASLKDVPATSAAGPVMSPPRPRMKRGE